MSNFFFVFKSKGRCILGLMVLCLALPLGAAEQKIGVIDMEKVFNSYYKTKIAEEALNRQRDIYVEYINKMQEEYRKLNESFVTARDGAQNIGLEASEREKFRTRAEELSRELMLKRSEIETYAAAREKDFMALERKKNDEIVQDITREVSRRATLENYTLVLDCSGKNSNAISPVVFCSPGYDLTEKVITELNRGNMPVKEAGNKNGATSITGSKEKQEE